MKQIRQGDVFLIEVDAIPKKAKQQKVEGDLVLAWGEATGHRHRIVSGAELWALERGRGLSAYA